VDLVAAVDTIVPQVAQALQAKVMMVAKAAKEIQIIQVAVAAEQEPLVKQVV